MDLPAAIAKALNQDAPYANYSNPGGSYREIHAGAIETDRVAWIEELCGEPEHHGAAAYYPVELTINVAGRATPHLRLELPTYNPFFGCLVRHICFYGDILIVVYEEKHETIAARVQIPSGALELTVVGDDCRVEDDLLCHSHYRDDRLNILTLPDFIPCVPAIPAEGLRLPTAEQRGPVTDHPAVWARLRELLAARTGMAEADADILIGTGAVPFLHTPVTISDRYGHGPEPHPSTPWWFPVAWHRYLDESSWPEWLEALAPSARTPGWDPTWTRNEGAAQMALAHIATHAAAMATACRQGTFPDDGWRAWRDWRQGWGHPLPLDDFPEGFRRAWEQLPPSHYPSGD
ncbi:hypothetical protein [Spirillospora sp. CA-294931]|uniref:hypothetical protein n=1 Tax=Spirillospora sp. CA-294931 TaxID=3240042 RepID=UPI003D8C93C5